MITLCSTFDIQHSFNDVDANALMPHYSSLFPVLQFSLQFESNSSVDAKDQNSDLLGSRLCRSFEFVTVPGRPSFGKPLSFKICIRCFLDLVFGDLIRLPVPETSCSWPKRLYCMAELIDTAPMR